MESALANPAPNPLDAAIAMKLAFWSYPHKNIEEAEKVAKYPTRWRHAEPGNDLPPGFDSYVPAQNGQPAIEGWNTQHNARGELINQFMVSINQDTKQITFDFKGSDNVSNFKSDFGNAGASEFARIEAQAQKALEAMQADERYKGFTFAATGHSLGGGMGQSFALRNNLDAYVYNSLPIARDTIKGDYFKEVGGFDAALARYQSSGRTVHDIRTPNDIATFTYDTVTRNQYLSDTVRPGIQQLPGAAIPDLLKAALMTSEVGAAPALAIMANDHRMGAMFDAQYGLGVNAEGGRFRIPEGHVDFAAIPAKVRQQFAELSTSPVSKVYQSERGATHDGATSAYNRFEISRADGSTQRLSIHVASGEVALDHHHADGRRTQVALDPRHPERMRVTETDAPNLTKAPAESTPAPLSATQQTQLKHIHAQLAPRLTAQGYNPEQIDQVGAATLVHLGRHAAKGDARGIHVSHDGVRIAISHEHHQLSELDVATALKKSTGEHLQEAVHAQVESGAPSTDRNQQPQMHRTPNPTEHAGAMQR
ncbi:hypothetical protein LPB72_21945 [Hydrogenophaga crassostreae]|uniref:Fungal lipase-like domain-containing protein n=1 Tax=Hydrogenophaga crassostreae TaxID=1763535 RepID=A0A162YPQ5_9BURK|nr:hypothetical protein [Hydrogenophaga crassostreae]AOW15173.1 hypothetical protein LPB072_22560 [Hydrogenophaga crassostreae]OAD39262.1 hypothetical protein LPB72_21945 [Hydrogenophaga crassostreae]